MSLKYYVDNKLIKTYNTINDLVEDFNNDLVLDSNIGFLKLDNKLEGE